MIVLGFDTATPSTAVGLRLADGSTFQLRDDPGAGEHPGHATRLLAMADRLLAQVGVGWSALDRIAVGLGPGTFTGLRVGVATARGLAQSLSAELVGVSSARALADVAATRHAAVLAVIDARRGEVFAAAYAASAPGSIGSAVELAAPRALGPGDLQSFIEDLATQAEESLGGPRDGRDCQWVGVGDGALRFRDRLASAGVAVPPDSSSLHHICAEAICRLGANATAATAYEEILPNYRRAPDAEIALAGAAARGGLGP